MHTWNINPQHPPTHPCYQPLRHQARLPNKRTLAVANDFCNRPSEEHGAVKGRGGGSLRVAVDDGPDEEEARGDLHCCSGEGGADESCHCTAVS